MYQTEFLSSLSFYMLGIFRGVKEQIINIINCTVCYKMVSTIEKEEGRA